MAQQTVKIEKDGNVLEVSERTYRIFYKPMDYKLVVEDEGGNQISMKSTKADIIAALEERNIEHDPESKKEELLNLLEGE